MQKWGQMIMSVQLTLKQRRKILLEGTVEETNGFYKESFAKSRQRKKFSEKNHLETARSLLPSLRDGW